MEQKKVREEVAEWLANYRPRDLSERRWIDTGLRSFVVEQVIRLDPAGLAYAKKCGRLLARLGDWCLRQSIELDVEQVLDPDTVERFATVALRDDLHAATHRSLLRTMGPKLTRKAPWEPRPARLSRPHLAQPYTSYEVAGFLRAVRQQRTPTRARSLEVFLALGMGAGLDGRWVHLIRATHVHVGDDAVIIEVPDPNPRRVPVLARWEKLVTELAATTEAGDTLLGGEPRKNTVSQRTKTIELGKGLPPLRSARFRSTWLAHHLAAGTRLPELAAAAGTTSITNLTDLLPTIEPLPEARSARALRNA